MAIIIVILLVILLFSMIAHFLKQCGKEGGIAIKIRITIMITNRVGIDGKRGTEYFSAIVSDDREKKMRAIRSNLNAQTRPCASVR